MLDFTFNIARSWPNLLEGTYSDRFTILKNLQRTTTDVLDRKSRRLQKIMPEASRIDQIQNTKERKQHEWNKPEF